MTATPIPSRSQRECTVCPPWVLRCAHWDEQILVIGGPMDCPDFEWAGYLVSFGTRFDPASARCGCVLMEGAGTQDYFPGLPAAEAEFRRREEEMLGQEVPHR